MTQPALDLSDFLQLASFLLVAMDDTASCVTQHCHVCVYRSLMLSMAFLTSGPELLVLSVLQFLTDEL